MKNRKRNRWLAVFLAVVVFTTVFWNIQIESKAVEVSNYNDFLTNYSDSTVSEIVLTSDLDFSSVTRVYRAAGDIKIIDLNGFSMYNVGSSVIGTITTDLRIINSSSTKSQISTKETVGNTPDDITYDQITISVYYGGSLTIGDNVDILEITNENTGLQEYCMKIKVTGSDTSGHASFCYKGVTHTVGTGTVIHSTSSDLVYSVYNPDSATYSLDSCNILYAYAQDGIYEIPDSFYSTYREITIAEGALTTGGTTNLHLSGSNTNYVEKFQINEDNVDVYSAVTTPVVVSGAAQLYVDWAVEEPEDLSYTFKYPQDVVNLNNRIFVLSGSAVGLVPDDGTILYDLKAGYMDVDGKMIFEGDSTSYTTRPDRTQYIKIEDFPYNYVSCQKEACVSADAVSDYSVKDGADAYVAGSWCANGIQIEAREGLKVARKLNDDEEDVYADGWSEWTDSVTFAEEGKNLVKEIVFYDDGTVVGPVVTKGKAYPASVTYSMDNTPPDIIGVVTNANGGIMAQDAIITVQAVDAVADETELLYSYDGGVTWEDSPTTIVPESRMVAAGTIQVKDENENISIYNTDINVEIDKENPVVMLNGEGDDNLTFDEYVTCHIADQCEVDVSLYKNGSTQPENITVEDNQFKIYQEAKETTYVLVVKDQVGNATRRSFTISPYVVGVQATEEEKAFLYGQEISYMIKLVNNEAYKASVKIDKVELEGNSDIQCECSNDNLEVAPTETCELNVKVKDKLETGSYKVLVDITYEDTESGQSKTVQVTTPIVVQKLDVQSDMYTLKGVIGENNWYISDVEIQAADGYVLLDESENELDSAITVTESRYTVEFRIKEVSSGAITKLEKIENIQIDKTAPMFGSTEGIVIGSSIWQELLSEITFGIYKPATVNGIISSQDLESGITSIGYYISEEVLSDDEIMNSVEYVNGSSFSMSGDGNKLVYAKIVNNAGLTTYICSNGMILDGVKPDIQGILDGESYELEADMEITIRDVNLDKVIVNDVETLCDGETHIITVAPATVETDYVIKAYDKSENETICNFTVLASVASEEPIASEDPLASEEPIASEDPLASEEPIASEDPLASEEPIASEDPLVSEEPIASEDPLASEEPIVSEVPLTSEEPLITKQPTTTQKTPVQSVAPETKQPLVSENVAVEEDNIIQHEQNVDEVKFVFSKSGRRSLQKGCKYWFDVGVWKVTGDDTVYQGGSAFYVTEDGEYEFTQE